MTTRVIVWLTSTALLLGMLALPPLAAQQPDDAPADTGRLAGPSRIDTAVEVAHAAFPDGADEVFLARADVLADALAAGSLTSGPVLLVPACGAAHYRIIRGRRRRAKAIGAVRHDILIAYWHIVTKHEPYQRPGTGLAPAPPLP